jgi:hypothetical protein
MRTTLVAGFAFIIALCLPAATMAQHGHPLAGIWLGDWGTAGNRSDVVLELYWMNTTLSGNINPGFPDAATIDVGELDSSNWTVHLEGTSKDEAGNPVKVVVDGQIENLGSAKRTLSGTWKRGSATGDFKLTRE